MNFLNKEPLKVALLIQPSIWEKVEDYFDEDPNKALAYLMMIGRYHFYGEEPSNFAGIFSRDTIRDANAERPLIEAHISKYLKATEGGKASNKISDEEFLRILEEGNCSTQEEIANQIGISKQAVSQRLKKLGINWKEWKKEKCPKLKEIVKIDENGQKVNEPLTEEPNPLTMEQIIARHMDDLL